MYKIALVFIAVSILCQCGTNAAANNITNLSGRDALDNFPLVDGHNDLPFNLYTLLNNTLKDFKFENNLTNDSLFGVNNCNSCHTDLTRLKKGKVGAQFWVAYVKCSDTKNTVARTLDQIDVIKRLINKYSNDLEFVTTADGCVGLYKGLTSSWMGQFVYASTRFSIFHYFKRTFPNQSFAQRIVIGGFSGLCGGIAGNPLDVVKVNMQNDSKRPPEERKNYSNGFNGLIRIGNEDGIQKLFMGVTFGTARAVVMSIGQLAMYDQMKQMFLNTGVEVFKDAILNHFISSFIAGIIAITITQPVDVMKTRLMTSEPGTYTGLWNCFVVTAREGIPAFYKGVFLAATRTMSMTVITFVVFEQLRQHLGYLPPEEPPRKPADAASNLTTATP